MRNPVQRLLVPATLAAAVLASSCAAPLVVGAVGGLVGVWVYDDFSRDRAEILMPATPERVFAAAEAAVNARADVGDLQVVRSSMRISYKDAKTKVEYQVVVLIVPGSPDYATLRVYAAEYGFRGRADLAKALGDEIAARV
jgi:nucleotide-binding universal stress UspA family protein